MAKQNWRRVSFQRGGTWPGRDDKRQTHYVCIGKKYAERCLGRIEPVWEPKGWLLTIDQHTTHARGPIRFDIPAHTAEFATLRAAKEAAREFLTRLYDLA